MYCSLLFWRKRRCFHRCRRPVSVSVSCVRVVEDCGRRMEILRSRPRRLKLLPLDGSIFYVENRRVHGVLCVFQGGHSIDGASGCRMTCTKSGSVCVWAFLCVMISRNKVNSCCPENSAGCFSSGAFFFIMLLDSPHDRFLVS